MWSILFSLTNLLALLGWMLLVFAPRQPLVHSIILYLCVAALCLTYLVLFALVLSGGLDPHRMAGAGEISGSSIGGVRAFFASDGGVVIGWTHYLAFDLFVGQWIARDADHKGVPRWAQLPILFLTLMAGPVGLVIWLVVRERRARAIARRV